MASHVDEVVLVVPGRRYPAFVVIECTSLGLAALVALGLGGLVVNRRRPT